MTRTPPKPTRSFTLDNGLHVIVREDHRTPAICASIFHKVGTRNERAGQRGLAYVAGGAPRMDKKRIEKIGAIANGWLDYDVSTYGLEAPRTAIVQVLDMLAGRMKTPDLSQKRLSAGIARAQALELDSPHFSSDYWITPEFEALIFPDAGPVHKFGDVADLDRLTIADVLRWHEEGYAPNNSTLVVVGDTSLEEIQPLVQRMFGAIPQFHGFTPVEQTSTVADKRPRTLTQYLDTPFARLQMAFNTPSLATVTNIQDIRALQVISALLTQGPHAWIPGRLPEGEKTLSSVISRLPAYRLSDDILLIAVTTHEHNALPLERIQADIQHLLDTLKTTPLDADTLDYGRTLALEQLQELDTLEIQCSIIGNLEAINRPWTLIDTEADELRSITAKDIQRAARLYFTTERLSVAYILPRTT